MSSSTKKTYQLALPPESPDNTNKKSTSKSDKKDKGQELKVVTNTKHMSISKKESLESLKQYQSDMKRQKLDNEKNENGENVQPDQQTKTATAPAGGKPKKDEPPKKTPYEILFEQNQRLVQELELTRHKLVLKEAHIREFDSENFALREYIVGLENSRDSYQTVYDQLLEEIQALKNENAEIRANIPKESQQKDLSHIETKAGDLFNQLHIFLLGKPYSNRQSCIMSSTISGSNSTMNPNASRISFDPRMSLNGSGNQQKKRCSMRVSVGNVSGAREMPAQGLVSGNGSEAMECSADRMEMVQEVNGEDVGEETVPQTQEDVVPEEEHDEDAEEVDEEEGECEEAVEEEEEEEVVEEEDEDEEEMDEDEEETEEEEEEDMEENEEMEHSDVVIGNDQSEYTVPPAQNDALLCTILETTELNESSTSRRSKPDSTYVCDSAGQSFSDQNPNEQNIMVDDTQMLDDSEDDEAENRPAEQSGRRKSVTFSEKLTQEKLIEAIQDKSDTQASNSTTTSTTKKIVKQMEQEVTVTTTTAPPQVIRFEHQPKPILKARASLSNSGNDDSGSDSGQRKSVSCSSRRKNSIVVDGNSGGSDRRRSRVSMYSIGGPSDTPLISEELMAQAAAYAAAEAAATRQEDSMNVDSEAQEIDSHESPVVVHDEVITEEEQTPTESTDLDPKPVSLVKRNSSFGIFKSKQKKLESDTEPTTTDSPDPEPELNKEIDKNFKDLSEFLFVESPFSEAKTVSLTKTKGTPKGGNKTNRKVNSTPTSARKKKEQTESVISSVKKAVKRKTIDKSDDSSGMEQDPEPQQQQNQLPPKPMAPKATPSGQRMKKNVSTENLINNPQSDRPQIPLPPGRKLTNQSSTDNLATAEQPVSLEPKATPTQGQRMKKNVSTENLSKAGDRPHVPLPPKATPGRTLTKANSVENLAASAADQENQTSLEPKATPTGGRLRKAVSTENLNQKQQESVSLEPKATPTRRLPRNSSAGKLVNYNESDDVEQTILLSLEPKSTPTRRLPRNSSAGKLVNYNESDDVEQAILLSLEPKSTTTRRIPRNSSAGKLVNYNESDDVEQPKKMSRNSSASNLPPQQPQPMDKCLEPKTTPARQLKKNNSTGTLLVEPKIEPKSTPARRMPAGNLVPQQLDDRENQQQQQPKATPARRMAKNNSAGNLIAASQQSDENQQSIEPKATPVRRMPKTDSAGKLPSGAAQPPPLPPKAPHKKMIERSENQQPLPPKAPSKPRAPLGTSNSENVPKPPLPVAAKKIPASPKTGGEYIREKILPRKSIGTINENRELNISEEVLEIKDEPADLSVEVNNYNNNKNKKRVKKEVDVEFETNDPVFKKLKLSSSSESSRHQEHKENRPDSPIRSEGRRARKPISYKELPVGSKMRRDGDSVVIKESHPRKSLKVDRYS